MVAQWPVPKNGMKGFGAHILLSCFLKFAIYSVFTFFNSLLSLVKLVHHVAFLAGPCENQSTYVPPGPSHSPCPAGFFCLPLFLQGAFGVWRRISVVCTSVALAFN